jgi:hypothetical protein
MLVVGFDRKCDLVDSQALTTRHLPIYVVRADQVDELKLAMLMPPAGMSITKFATSLVELIAGQFHLWASRRLLFETLNALLRRPRPSGQWPCLFEWIDMIEAIRVSALSRLGGYREAAMYTLRQINCELGHILNYTSSNFLEQVFSLRGCVVVVTEGLSADMAAFLAGMFASYAYHSRAGINPDLLSEVLFILDDSLPLLKAGAWESEGGTHPLVEATFMSRARRIGFVASLQNFSLVSPAFKNNAQSTVVFSSYGRDAEELGRHLNLTREQAAVLPTLRPGQLVACCRSVWPLPVFGSFGELP